MKVIRKLSVYFFLLVCMHMMVPASLLHSFCSHEDTVHCHSNSELTISEEHHHCIAPELSLPPLFSCCDIWEYDLHVTAALNFVFISAEPAFIPFADDNNRGPPAG